MDRKPARYSSGPRIISFADTVKIILSLPFVLGGIGVIVLFAKARNIVVGLLIGAAIIAIGLLLASFATMLMRGFGEMVQNTAEIADSLQNRGAKGNEGEAGSWKCACGRINMGYISTCACGKNKRDQ